MKKWIAASLIVLVLVVIYILLPTEISVQQRISFKVNANSAYRNVADQNNWSKWWPQERPSIKAQAPFALKQITYQLQQRFFQSLLIQVNSGDKKILSTLSFIPLGIDYTIFEWKAVVQGGPWEKIRTYLDAKQIQGQMADILQSLKEYIEKDENLYGFNVKLTKQKDTTLIATKFITNAYPQTNDIYQYISQLKAYIASQSATEINYPMLHVQQLDSSRFESMVAIPTSRELRGSGDIFLKRMIQGNILETEVRGGAVTAQEAMVQLGNYLEDHQLASPAIPFMLLVTDRSKEQDTAKWVTRVYYPVY
ncbi:hypothetical protein OCK74_25000 [Chitinophagaceae bacterium LB-8]|uniref:GyrI-like small molecule binding domain-containing protein n=1 Tax=Paraflavisolibacter caeni TaxID=2982496 RepID=A0A9X2Y0T3_9BACT|nr:hypothetical protein [Paraflavisolibacter caeni]MCU7552402.1 hypothetical protein [Paraflavisolibacter caeni]